MKNHMMKLNPSPFKMIKEGNKTIELRLYDEKRKMISVGDTITFVNTADSYDTLCVKVTDLFLVHLMSYIKTYHCWNVVIRRKI